MKLLIIQNELKVPKDQRNDFGNYKYRSCEDIVEAAKPLLAKHGFALILTDDLVQIGNWNYVKATARITDGKEHYETTAFAREQEVKKGMDASQITGSASSYARKYALNGLLAIDDTRDADSGNNHENGSGESEAVTAEKTVKRAVKNRQADIVPGDIVVHLGTTTKGKKVSELNPEQLTYFAEQFTPKSTQDRFLKEACEQMQPEKEF